MAVFFFAPCLRDKIQSIRAIHAIGVIRGYNFKRQEVTFGL